MSGISISKSYAVLLGLEAYGSVRKGKKKAESKMRGATEKAGVRSKDEEGKSKDEDGGRLEDRAGFRTGRGDGDSASAAETLVPTEIEVCVDRKIIKEKEEKRTENGLAPRIMRKLGFESWKSKVGST